MVLTCSSVNIAGNSSVFPAQNFASICSRQARQKYIEFGSLASIDSMIDCKGWYFFE